MFREKYTPYITNGSLMQGQPRFHWYKMGPVVLALLVPLVALITSTWGVIIFISIPIFLIGCIIDDNGKFYLISQKRVPIDLSQHTMSWYDENRMKILPDYNNAVVEYLEYLRLGQERNEYVEQELWKMHVNLFKEYDEQMNMEKIFIADQFPALKQYKMFKEHK